MNGGDLPQEDDLLAVDQLEIIFSKSEISEEQPEMDASFVSTSGHNLESQKSRGDTADSQPEISIASGKVRHLE